MSKNVDSKHELRFANHEKVCLKLESEGYKKIESTISMSKANIMALVTSGPIAVILFVIYLIVNTKISTDMAFEFYFAFVIAMIISIPIHEGIHGIFFALFSKKHFKSVEFGVVWKSLTPYCHCKEALRTGEYYCALLAPMVILGLIPSIIGIIMGNFFLLTVGMINVLAAGGDFTIAIILLKFIGKKALIADHPIKCGCVTFLK